MRLLEISGIVAWELETTTASNRSDGTIKAQLAPLVPRQWFAVREQHYVEPPPPTNVRCGPASSRFIANRCRLLSRLFFVVRYSLRRHRERAQWCLAEISRLTQTRILR